MTKILETIQNRRSIRKFEDKNISDEILYKIFESVKWAPSWANTQCWEIIIVKDQDIKESLQTTMIKGNPATKAIMQAPVVLVICGKVNTSGFYKETVTTKFGDWMLFDLGIASQNICLTTHELGLGSVIVALFDHDKAKEILNVPDNFEVVAYIPIGYPAKISSAPARRDINEFIHFEKF